MGCINKAYGEMQRDKLRKNYYRNKKLGQLTLTDVREAYAMGIIDKDEYEMQKILARKK